MSNFTKHTFIYIICFFFLIFVTFSISNGNNVNHIKIKRGDTIITPIPRMGLDTVINVNGKIALFIGDSHTANFKNGWQRLVGTETGLKVINTSVSGKTTYWMLEIGVYKITDNIDYCFIYGGANDMYSASITPEDAIENIKGIIRICQAHGVHPVVLTGFDPNITRTPNKNYIPKYMKFQKLLLTSLKGATVIDVRVVSKQDCWDGLCHMSPSGHRKMADKVISDMKFMKK
jgi:lysophospholipase L1-like esterase